MFSKEPNPQTCLRCPNRYRKEGCPCWITPEFGFIEKNSVTGEQRIATGCFYEIIPKLMAHIVGVVEETTGYVQATRNTIYEGLKEFVAALPPPQATPLIVHEDQDGRETEE